MRVKNVTTVIATFMMASAAVGLGANAAQAAPATTPSPSTSAVSADPNLQSDFWRISGMSLTYNGTTNATGDPVRGSINQPTLFGARFDNGSRSGPAWVMTTSLSGEYTFRDNERVVASFHIAPGAVEQKDNVLRYALTDGNQKATLTINLLVGTR